MQVIKTPDGLPLLVTSEQWSVLQRLAALSPAQLQALLDLADCQIMLEAYVPLEDPAPRPTLRVVNGAISHTIASCRKRMLARNTGDSEPTCEWTRDTYGFTCKCGTWVGEETGIGAALLAAQE